MSEALASAPLADADCGVTHKAAALPLHAVHRSGRGDAVVMLHGFGSAGAPSWQRTGWSEALHRRGYEVLVPDLRGHGGSPTPHEASAYSPELFAADVLALCDAHSIHRAHVLAHSMGCVVALALEHRWPERVLSLTLCGAGLADPLLGRDLAADRRYLLDGVPQPDGSTAVLAAARRSRRTDALAVLACMEGMAGHGVTGSPGVPTLVVAGGADAVVPDAPELAAAIGAPVHIAPGCGHGDMLRDDGVRSAVLDFLARAADARTE